MMKTGFFWMIMRFTFSDFILNLFSSVLGSDVVYSENAVVDLLVTLGQLSGPQTTIFLAGELRNGKRA